MAKFLSAIQSAMMKKISKLIYILLCAIGLSASASVTEKFITVEFTLKPDASLSTIKMKAEARATRTVRKLAYISLAKRKAPNLEKCWLELLRNKKVSFEDANINLLFLHNAHPYTFRLTFDLSKLKIFGITKREFEQHCMPDSY